MDYTRPLSYHAAHWHGSDRSGLFLTAYMYSPRVYRESALRQTHGPTGFDADLYLYQPPESASISPFVVSSQDNQSPAFLNVSSGISSNKPMTELSPATPPPNLFSPSGFWATTTSSVSPIVRHTSPEVGNHCSQLRICGSGHASNRKTQSLAAYRMAQERRPQSRSPALSASSLSSLSSVSSSPSVQGVPASSQDSLSVSALSAQLPKTVGSPQNRPLFVSTRLLAPVQRNAINNNYGERYNTRSRPPETRAEALNLPSNRNKRGLQDQDYPMELSSPKRRRAGGSDAVGRRAIGKDAPTTAVESPSPLHNRTFPLRVPIHPEFSLFYRRFPVSSYREGDSDDYLTCKALSDAMFNAPRDPFDLYTPRFVKGKGTTKVGLCPCCCEPVARSGEGKKVWLSMKFSAFKCYHMQYAHGISAMTGRPFSPPVAFRTVARSIVGKHEKPEIMQGKCHKCIKWIAIEGIKDVPTKVKEIYWWKHAAACHQGSTIDGECDIYVEDGVYKALSDGASSE